MITKLFLLSGSLALVACSQPAPSTSTADGVGRGKLAVTVADSERGTRVAEPAGDTDQAGHCAVPKRPPQIPLEQLSARLSSKQAVAVDANGTVARDAFGIIPGAIQLSSFDEYQLSELPEDRSTELVFYCSNTRCSAAPHAARLAMAAGYCNVQVYPGGIMGWVKAGQDVDVATTG